MCRISIRNDFCVSQVTMILPVIIPYFSEEIMFHISLEYQLRQVIVQLQWPHRHVKTTTSFLQWYIYAGMKTYVYFLPSAEHQEWLQSLMHLENDATELPTHTFKTTYFCSAPSPMHPTVPSLSPLCVMSSRRWRQLQKNHKNVLIHDM